MAPDPPRLTVTASGRASLNRSARHAALSPPAAPGCRSPSGLGATDRSNTASISAARSPRPKLRCDPRVALALLYLVYAPAATRRELADRHKRFDGDDDDDDGRSGGGLILGWCVRARGRREKDQD